MSNEFLEYIKTFLKNREYAGSATALFMHLTCDLNYHTSIGFEASQYAEKHSLYEKLCKPTEGAIILKKLKP